MNLLKKILNCYHLNTPRLKIYNNRGQFLMYKNNAVIGGLDASIFDTRSFKITKKQLGLFCENFNTGKFLERLKEINIPLSHSNFVIFVKTTKGKFVLKFFPKASPKDITIEYTLNRIFKENYLLTPTMYINQNNRPFSKLNGYLISCYDFIEGKTMYQEKLDSRRIEKINVTMEKLNKVLASSLDKTNLNTILVKETISEKLQSLKDLAVQLPHGKEKEYSFKEIENLCSFYLAHPDSLQKMIIHSNITLANLIHNREGIYILDLIHVRMDYQINDLANLIESALILKIPYPILNAIVHGYFYKHDFPRSKNELLFAFIRMHLLKGYLKIVTRKDSLPPAKSNLRLYRLYLSEKIKQKNLRINLLKQFSGHRMDIIK